MKKFFAALFALALIFAPSASFSQELKENKKIVLNENYSFKYVFPEKPKLGTSVIKIEVFDKDGNKTDKLSIVGGYDMPQMRGHHSSGPVKFRLNKNGDYLMPLNSVMRGLWEILLVFYENGEEIYSGAINIKI